MMSISECYLQFFWHSFKQGFDSTVFISCQNGSLKIGDHWPHGHSLLSFPVAFSVCRGHFLSNFNWAILLCRALLFKALLLSLPLIPSINIKPYCFIFCPMLYSGHQESGKSFRRSLQFSSALQTGLSFFRPPSLTRGTQEVTRSSCS